MSTPGPLVTFALIAYKQESFIREAVAGAFAQTYTPLEIILSDDCSSDATFHIIQEMADAYKGPHTIVLNRNETNLGLGAHVNRIMEIAKGELIVVAAGDDVSLPHRTARLVKCWEEQGHPSAMCSRFQLISAEGQSLPTDGWDKIIDKSICDARAERETRVAQFIKRRSPALIGCAEAWHRDLFHVFGDIGRQAIQEDVALSLRALLHDTIGYSKEALVLYRTHDNNIWGKQLVPDRSPEGFRRIEALISYRARSELNLSIGFRRDLRTGLRKGFVSKPVYEDLVPEIRKLAHRAYIKSYWWRISWLRRVCYALTVLLPFGAAGDLAWSIPRLLPLNVFLGLRSSASRAKAAVRIVLSIMRTQYHKVVPCLKSLPVKENERRERCDR